MVAYYDKARRPISSDEWSRRLFGDMEYRRVAETTIGGFWVSTVWIGLDHSSGMDGPPLIFETMVFGRSCDPLAERYVRRYATEAAALAGHKEVVADVRASVGWVADITTHAPTDPENGP